uniref:Geminin coiled-coil domain containing n=1 Tax=Kryptolebias marmoratus TaxID=37003 RepID=A0A3Q2ZL88_KRYMA
GLSSRDIADVSMETLSPLWVPGLHELCDLSESSNMSSPDVEALNVGVFERFQLQDALLQREEELARLQEENSKLREFLNSSFVRNLQQKAQIKKEEIKSAENLKRTLTGPSLLSKHISKRVCRNLTAEFCSESCSEPNLDHWVLRTLGLKDRDTIDTTSESSPEDTFRGPSSSSEWTPGSCFSFPVDPLTPSSVHSCCQRPEPEPGLSQPYDGPDRPTQNCSRTPGDFTAPGSQPPDPLQVPHRQTDLAFSMSLSPSSSVKTHSFPQGQAFVRRDTGGRWNFTWVPRQEP